MSGGGNGGTSESVCARHDAELSQALADERILFAAVRDLDSRQSTTEGALGQIAAELATCRRASERAADAAMGTLSAVTDLARANASAHEHLSGRVAALESERPRPAPSLPDYDVGEDTRVSVLAGDAHSVMRKLVAEREARVAAEARLAERDRQSTRAIARDQIALKKWQVIAGIIASLAGAGGGIWALASMLGGH